jgi:O-antigen ligase
LLVAIMPLEDHPIWGRQIVGTLTITKMVGILCLLAALLYVLTRGYLPSLFGSTASRWFAAYFLLECSSYLVHGGRLATPLNDYSHILSIFFLFVTTLALVDSRLKLQRSLLVTIGGVGFTSLYAVREWQEYHALYPGFRPTGMLSDSNEYALVAGLWLPLAFLWAFGKRPRWEKVFCLGCFAACLLGTTFAASRGGFLGLIASFLFLIWHSRRRARNLALVGVLLLPLALLTSHSAVDRFLHPEAGDQYAQQARLVAWEAGWKMIKTHPMLGVGLGNFRPMMPAYRAKGVEIVTLAHNTYVEIAADLGLPGLILFLGTWVASFRMLGRLRRGNQTGPMGSLSPIALGLQAGLVAYVVDAFFLSTWWYKMCWLLLFLALCLDRLAKAAPASRVQVSSAGRDWPSDADSQGGAEGPFRPVSASQH